MTVVEHLISDIGCKLPFRLQSVADLEGVQGVPAISRTPDSASRDEKTWARTHNSAKR